jgi:hypothetical protein
MIITPPLLVAMSGRKPRARKERVPVPLESRLHTDVADLLRAHCLPTWRWRFINAKAANAREGAILKRMGANAGWADFIIISARRACFLELKREGEEIEDGSPQDYFRLWCIENGIPHVVAWTMDQVLTALSEWGCLRVEYRGKDGAMSLDDWGA